MEIIIKIPEDLKRYVWVLEDGLRSLSHQPTVESFSLTERSCYVRVALTPKAQEYFEKIKKDRRAKNMSDEEIIQSALIRAKNERARPVEKYCPFVS